MRTDKYSKKAIKGVASTNMAMNPVNELGLLSFDRKKTFKFLFYIMTDSVNWLDWIQELIFQA